jgi:hypothetical protein
MSASVTPLSRARRRRRLSFEVGDLAAHGRLGDGRHLGLVLIIPPTASAISSMHSMLMSVESMSNAIIVQAALARLQPLPDQIEVRSAQFGIYPRHDAQGRLTAWQGQADLVIEGRDFAQVGQLAAGLARMTVTQASFSLSRQARQQLEAQVQSQAVQSFRQRAQALARDFGFSGYSLRQVSVSSVERPGAHPAPFAARSRGSGRARSMRSLSLPASLMCLFFCTRPMMVMGSMGASFLKVMWITPGAASTLTTP